MAGAGQEVTLAAVAVQCLLCGAAATPANPVVVGQVRKGLAKATPYTHGYRCADRVACKARLAQTVSAAPATSDKEREDA